MSGLEALCDFRVASPPYLAPLYLVLVTFFSRVLQATVSHQKLTFDLILFDLVKIFPYSSIVYIIVPVVV